MATINQSDLVEFNEIKEGPDGFEATRGFQIEGLAGNADQKSFEALGIPGIPNINDVHPSFSILNVVEKRFETQGPTIGVVIVSYKQLNADEQEAGSTSAPIISIGSTVQEDVVNLDVNGKQMLLFHTKVKKIINAFLLVEEKPEKMPTQPGEVSMQFPQMTVSFQRREGESPFLKNEKHNGTINSRGFFQLGIHEWLCTGIDGESSDGGRTFLVTYKFQRAQKGNTWDPMLVYIDPETDAPVAGLNINGGDGPLSLTGEPPNKTGDPNQVGRKRFQVYPETDFNELNLDFGQGGGAGIVITRAGSTKLRFPALN